MAPMVSGPLAALVFGQAAGFFRRYLGQVEVWLKMPPADPCMAGVVDLVGFRILGGPSGCRYESPRGCFCSCWQSRGATRIEVIRQITIDYADLSQILECAEYNL